MERDSSFFCNLHFVPVRLYGVLCRITSAILSGRAATGFNEQKNVAGKHGVHMKCTK